MTKIKTCPFCNELPIVRDDAAIVSCRNKRCEVRPAVSRFTCEDAIASWNKRPEPITAEEFATFLWPGMFKPGWREADPTSAFFQAECFCLKKAEQMLEEIEMRHRSL